jgi:hypothetical protein
MQSRSKGMQATRKPASEVTSVQYAAGLIAYIHDEVISNVQSYGLSVFGDV